MTRLPGWLDRYPAKMVSGLASRLVQSFVVGSEHRATILDPFCGSGAILDAACSEPGMEVRGTDISPYAVLLTGVKVSSFNGIRAMAIGEDLVRLAADGAHLPLRWDRKAYWFESQTLHELEALRGAAQKLSLVSSREGRAVLLALALAMRLCSRADQRSPKPFISKRAREVRSGVYYDPRAVVIRNLRAICKAHGDRSNSGTNVVVGWDAVVDGPLAVATGVCSHVLTSPPYINAQDYYRNSKMELFLLEGLMPFRTAELATRFIGTDRGRLVWGLRADLLDEVDALVPEVGCIKRKSERHANVVRRYFHDMAVAIDNIRTALRPGGRFVLVCGDNVVGGVHVRTWKILEAMMANRGFVLRSRFQDRISRRYLPPKRSGHRWIIKDEVVSEFQLLRSQ